MRTWVLLHPQVWLGCASDPRRDVSTLVHGYLTYPSQISPPLSHSFLVRTTYRRPEPEGRRTYVTREYATSKAGGGLGDAYMPPQAGGVYPSDLANTGRDHMTPNSQLSRQRDRTDICHLRRIAYVHEIAELGGKNQGCSWFHCPDTRNVHVFCESAPGSRSGWICTSQFGRSRESPKQLHSVMPSDLDRSFSQLSSSLRCFSDLM